MLRVRILRASDGAVVGLEARGHAGLDRKGRDVACAGVSAVVHTAVLGVARAAGLSPSVKARGGYLELRLEDRDRQRPAGWERAQAILEAAVLGVREIARQYPDHVEVVEAGPEVGPRPDMREG